MLTNDELRESPRKFVSFTSLTRDEFDLLLPAFEQAYLRKNPASMTKTGAPRKRTAGAGRKGSPASIEQKWLLPWCTRNTARCNPCWASCLGWGKDTGFQGYEPKVRVRVERAMAGVKRSRTMKELLRHIKFPL